MSKLVEIKDPLKGAFVNFNELCSSVHRFEAMPLDSDHEATIDFIDKPKPKGLTVYLFNSKGEKITGEVMLRTWGKI